MMIAKISNKDSKMLFLWGETLKKLDPLAYQNIQETLITRPIFIFIFVM